MVSSLVGPELFHQNITPSFLLLKSTQKAFPFSRSIHTYYHRAQPVDTNRETWAGIRPSRCDRELVRCSKIKAVFDQEEDVVLTKDPGL